MVILPVGKTLGIVANRVVEEGNTKGGIAQIQRPAYGGNNCTGNTSRTISCNSHACSGIQTKEFLLLLCTEILQFASKLSTLCLVSCICFGLLCKRFVSVL